MDALRRKKICTNNRERKEIDRRAPGNNDNRARDNITRANARHVNLQRRNFLRARRDGKPGRSTRIVSRDKIEIYLLSDKLSG